jgi:hypothetical protein
MYDVLPQFEFHDEAIGDVITRAGAALGLLFVSGLLLAAIGLYRLRHFPVAG